MVVERGCLGVVGLRFPETQKLLSAEQRLLAEAVVQQIALAADRAHLVADLETARVESETERLRTALLSSVSHDLRSPLAAVIGAASSLSAYGETMPEADRQELLGSIRSEGERLDRYIQNLLDMTRLGSGRMKLQRDWVGIDEMLGLGGGAPAQALPRAPGRDRLAPDLPLLFVHPALIEQASSTSSRTPPRCPSRGAGAGDRGAASNDNWWSQIIDRGPGIPDEERRRIFDMFYSVRRGDRSSAGTGLGLAIVRGMVGAHQGKVEALAGPGRRRHRDSGHASDGGSSSPEKSRRRMTATRARRSGS